MNRNGKIASVENALKLRNKAEQTRLVARQTTEPDFRETLLKLAAEYDLLADDIERQIKADRGER